MVVTLLKFLPEGEWFRSLRSLNHSVRPPSQSFGEDAPASISSQHYEKRLLFLALRISKKKAEFFWPFFFLSLQTLSKHFGKQVFHTVYTLVATENESRQTKKDEFHWRKWNVNLCRILSRPSRPRANQTYSIYFLSPPPSRFFLESSEMLVLLLF